MLNFIKRALGFEKPSRITIPVKNFEPEPAPQTTAVPPTVNAAKKPKPRATTSRQPSAPSRPSKRSTYACDSDQSDYFTSREYPVIDATPIVVATTSSWSNESYSSSSCDNSSSYSSDSGSSSSSDSGGGSCGGGD